MAVPGCVAPGVLNPLGVSDRGTLGPMRDRLAEALAPQSSRVADRTNRPHGAFPRLGLADLHQNNTAS